MNQSEFLEKQWIGYKKVCDEKGIDAGTKEAFIERQTPKDYKPDVLLDKTPKTQPLRIKEHVTDINVGDTNVVEMLPLFKIKQFEGYILTKEQFEEYLKRAYEAGRASA